MQSWIEYWNQDTSIYVNARHKQLHYQSIAADIRSSMRPSDKTILDYGCGEAICADEIARSSICLYLCDGAETVRQKLGSRFSNTQNIQIIAPADFQAIKDSSLDLIIINSVLQYLNRSEFDELLETCAAKLKPDGRLILADIIPPNISALQDAYALMQFAFKGGFLFAAIGGLMRTLLSDYRTIRSDLGLSTYSEADFTQILGANGFRIQRMPKNIGHNQARMCFEGVKV